MITFFIIRLVILRIIINFIRAPYGLLHDVAPRMGVSMLYERRGERQMATVVGVRVVPDTYRLNTKDATIITINTYSDVFGSLHLSTVLVLYPSINSSQW